MSRGQKTVGLDALLNQSTPQQQTAIDTSGPGRSITTDDGFLTCPQCGFDHLHHEGATIYAGGEAAGPRPVISLDDIGDQADAAPSVTMEFRTAPDNPSASRGAVCTNYWCEGCHGEFRLVQAQHKGRTEMYWEAL